MPNANHKLLRKRAKRALLSKSIDINTYQSKHLRKMELSRIEPEIQSKTPPDTGKTRRFSDKIF